MFRDEWRSRGGLGRARLTVRSVVDLTWTALRVRVGAGREHGISEEGMMTTRWIGLGLDVRTSLRALRRSPLFTVTATLSLAMGFGGVATVYSLADHMLLDPIEGVRAPDELVELTPSGLPYPVVQDFQQGVRGLTGVAAHRMRTVALELGSGAEARPVQAGVVSGNYFDLLGVAPARGRLLTPADTIQGASPVTVLSHAVWSELGERDDIVGSDVRINGASFRVVGVAPARFVGLRLWAHPAVWIPVESWPLASLGRTPDVHSRGWGWIAAVGRLAPGASLASATQEARVTAQRIATEHPENAGDLDDLGVSPARLRVADQAGGVLQPLLLALAGMALLALLAAAANVANLLLARATRRTRELAVRAALGAGRARLARLAFVECALLVAAGGLLGAGLSFLALRGLGAVTLPGGIRIGAGLSPDPRFMALAGALLLAVVVVAGLAPVLAASRASARMAGSDRSGGASPRSIRLRAGLAAIQVSAGVVLLAGTLLFGQSILNALRVDLGFDARRMAVVRIDASLFRDDLGSAGSALSRLLDDIRRQPGIDAASWSTVAPLTRDWEQESFDIVGRAWPNRKPTVEVNAVGGNFFAASGIPLLAGDPGAVRAPVRTPSVVVTEAMARRYWPGESPVGSHVVIMGMELQVVAVAADTRFHGFDADPTPTAFGLLPVLPSSSISIVARGPGAESLLGSVRGLARAVDTRLVVADQATGDSMVGLLLAPQRVGGAVALLFALLAIALSLTGVYGVVAYGVTARLREFGVRLTLGAGPGRVTGEVLRRNLGVMVGGVLLGVAVSLILTRLGAAYLFGVATSDALPALVAGLGVLVMATVAMWMPARRAGQVDPATVLAAE